MILLFQTTTVWTALTSVILLVNTQLGRVYLQRDKRLGSQLKERYGAKRSPGVAIQNMGNRNGIIATPNFIESRLSSGRNVRPRTALQSKGRPTLRRQNGSNSSTIWR